MSSKHPDFDEQQRVTDEMLQKVFADETVPRLSSDFNARLLARLQREPDTVQHVSPTPLLSRNGKLLMRLYWTAACLASSFILFHIEWSLSRPPIFLTATIAVSLISLSPLLLARQVRTRLPDLLLTVVE
jgi:hypothetical protein